MKTYHIKNGYQHKTVNTSLEEASGDYWTPKRHKASWYYQWDDYRTARELACTGRVRTVLDVGCGPAHKLMKLVAPYAETTGLDQPTIIEIAR